EQDEAHFGRSLYPLGLLDHICRACAGRRADAVPARQPLGLVL
ncbi:MAG: hypothetical protein AVDCRST_MAG71-2832, partial [uncultured Lysobacter sp.]